MPKDKPLYTLYKSLKDNNYNVPDDYASFEATLTQKGDKGTKARLQLHKSLVQNNYDVPNDYASFANTLFVPTKSVGSSTMQTANKPQTSHKESRRVGMGRLHDGESALPQKSNDGMDRAFNKAIGLGDKNNIQNLKRTTMMADDIKPMQGAAKPYYPKPKNKNVGKVGIFENGVFRDAYLTDDGTKTYDPEEADNKQNYIDLVNKAIGEEWDKARKREVDAYTRNEREATKRVNWGGRGTVFEGAVNQGVSNVAAHMTAFDLQKMADRTWAKTKSALTNYYYKQLDPHAKKADNPELLKQAEALARQKSDQSVYEYAVRQNAPKGALDYLAKSVADNNLTSSIVKGAARVKAGTTGDMDAYDEAMARYGEAHPWQAVGGTVMGMGADPTTYIGGFAGGQAGKLALRAVGKVMLRKGAVKAVEGVGTRLAGRTLGGRLAASVGSGIGNLGYYETSKNIEDQWQHGGALNQETGKREYSVMDAVKSTGRGAMLGGTMGIFGPMIGNVTDKWVRGTNSAWGKTGIKAGGYLTSAVAEGTIFAAPEFVHNMMLADGDPNKRSYMDIWGGSMAQIAGFKASGAVKGLVHAPEFIHSLRPISNPKTPADYKRNRLSFGEVWGKMLDRTSNDLNFTKEEIAELKAAGHLKLADLFKRTKSESAPKVKDGKAMPKVTDSKDRKVIYFNPIQKREDVGQLDFDGYDAMEALMRDKTVSQSTRAKAYYILTGRGLPMSTVIGYSKVKDADGNGVTIKATAADDEVVTSKHFKSDNDADGYISNIKRQAELNYIEAGEFGVEEQVSNDVFIDVVRKKFAGEDLQKVVDTYANYVSGKDKSGEAKAIFDKIQDGLEQKKEDIKGKLPEAIRERIRKTTGVDVDKALQKNDGKRSQEEQNAINEYIKRLYEGREKPKKETSATDEIVDGGVEPPMGVDTDDAEHEPLREEQPKDPRENQDTGMLHGATLKVDDKHVHIVSGRVVAREDGTIDEAASDPTIVVYNDETGEKEMFSPKDFRSVEEPTSADVPPSLAFQDNVSYVGEDGMQRRGIVNRVNEDGTIEVVTDDGRIERYGQDDFANIVDEVERDGEIVFKREAKAEDERGGATESGAAESGVPTEEVRPISEEEKSSAEDVKPREDAKIAEEKPKAEGDATEEKHSTEEDVKSTTDGVKPTDGGAKAEVELPKVGDDAPQTALERIPKDEKGEPKYEETDAKTAWDAIVEQTDGDVDMAEMIVDSMIGDKIKELDGLRKKGIMSGGTIAEKIAAEKKLRGEIEDAQRVLGHWQEIKKQKGWKEGVSDEGKGEVANDEVTNAIEGKSEEKKPIEGKSEEKVDEGKGEGDAPKGGKMVEEKPKTEGEVLKGDERADGKEDVSKAADGEEGKKVNGGNKEDAAEEKSAEEKIAAEKKKSSGEKTSEGKPASEVKSTEEKKPIEVKSDGKEVKVDNGEASDSEEGVKNENGSSEVEEIAPIGKGVFGNIYDQFKGKVKEAFAFLKKIGGGEALAVLHHKDVGDIALVWGNEKAGAMKILRKHPEVVDNLQELMDGMHVVSSSDNRIVLESDTHKAVVSKKLGNKETGQWLLTAYEKKNAAKGGSSDIGPKPQTEGGKQNGTAPLQDGSSSEGKGTKNGDGVQGDEGKKTSENDAEDVREVTFKRLQKAVCGVLEALKSGDGKDDAIAELKRVVKDSDKEICCKIFLDNYWQCYRILKRDGENYGNAIKIETLGYLRDALTENGVVVNDGAKGVKVGDFVCRKEKDMMDRWYDEYVGRVVSVDRSSVVLDDGTKVGKRSALGYCRVVDDGLEKPKGGTTKNGGATENNTEKPSTEKPKEKSKDGNAVVDTAADDGSEKKPNGDGVSERKVETASEGEKKPNGEKSTEKPTEKKPKGEEKPKENEPKGVKKPKEEKPKEEKKGESEEKIDDVGEKIAGARKDALREMAKGMDDVTMESLIALPFAKAFKRPKLRDAVEKGVLREKDARFAEAVMCAFLSKAKPRLLSGLKAQKSKREIEAWAKEAYNGVKLLKMLMDGDEGKRDALIEEVMGWKMYDEEEVKAKQRQFEEWNEGKKFEGECYPINPVKFFMDVFERLGYDNYGEMKLPFVGVRPDMTFDSYDLVRANGKKIYLRSDMTSYDDVVNEAVYLTKLMFADEDLNHPKDRFKLKSDDPIYETLGWMVNAVTVKGKNQSVKQHTFKTKEEAEKFREEFKEKMGKNGYVGPALEDKRFEAWGSFEIALHNDLTDAYVDSGLKFKTREEALAAIDGEYERLNEIVNGKLREALEANGEKGGVKKDSVSVMQMFKDGKWKYAVVLDDKYAPRQKTAFNTMPYTLAEGFEKKEDAEKYIEEHRGEIDARVEEIKKRRREFVYFYGKDNPRVGEDYRKGEDVTAEQFREQFGFRGVQFGNWTNQRDRQAAVNNAFDSFMDLARVLGVSPRALSLNGELGIAFGARGGGKASAHYELNEVVINLTKTKGAGSLAHEWWHALDNYFARRGNVKLGMVTENKGIEMREELRDAFNALVDEVVKSDYDKRSTKEGAYWGSRSEETARLFETWVGDELLKRGEVNIFLTSKNPMIEEKFARMNYSEYKWFAEFAGKEAMSFEDYRKTASALNGFVYPTRGELDVLGLKVRKIFDTIQTRVDEATKNVVMYHRGKVVERTRSKAERALLGAVIGIQKRMGLNVLTDVDEGQRVLDMVNGGAREHRVFHGSGADFEKFDHAHMGEGEGAQAFGWGTYVTEVEGIGRTYAKMGKDGKGTLYSVEIPDDTGENYFYLDRRVSAKDLGKIEEWVKDYLMKNEGYSERDAMQTVRDFYLGDATGYELVNTLRMEMPEKEVSKMLSELGYVGSSFPSNWEVGFEVDMYGKKRDYVVFNEGDLAITEHVKFFRTSDGEAYGFTVGGRIYLDPRVATTETAVHEYAHLWAEALREGNREEWDNVVKLMKGTKVWDEVKRLYPELKGDDEMADEVVAMYSGRRGAERLREEMRKVMEGDGSLKERAAAVSALGRVRDALKKFWMGVADFLGIHFTSAEEVADRVMADMLRGVDPTKVKKSERVKKQIIGERGAERLDRDEMERGERMRNLDVAKAMAKEGRDGKTVKLATGWERGKDGMWRYEVGDLRVKGRKVSEPIAKLGDLVDAEELFKAYPGLRDVDVVVDKSGKSGRRGSYSRLDGHISLNRDFFKEVHAPVVNGEAIARERARLEKLYDGLSEEEKIFADDGVDHFGGFTEEELARDVAFQRLESNRPKVAAYIREALKVGQGDGGEVIGYRLNDDEQTCEVLTHEVQHAIQYLEGFDGGGNPKMGKHIARESNKLTEMQQKLVDDVRMYDEMMDDERSREKYPLSAFIRDNVRDGVYDEDFGKDLVGMSDEELRGEAERLMRMDGERLDGFEAYRRLAGEVEARNASTRRGMGMDEKRRSLFEETEDVPREKQILQRGESGDESAMAVGEPYDYEKHPLGRVEKGLAERDVSIVDGDEKHGFKNYADAKEWAREHIVRTYDEEETGGKGRIRISNTAIGKFLSESAVDKSDSRDVHMGVLKVLPEVLKTSIDAETHPDFLKGEDGTRGPKNGMNRDVLVHRLYGAVRMGGKLYRVKVTLKENVRTKETNNAYSYEATKIELLEGTISKTEGSRDLEPSNSKPELSAGQHGNVFGLTSTFPRYSDSSIAAAKLLKGVEKTYEPGKKLLDESENSALYRDGDNQSSTEKKENGVVMRVKKAVERIHNEWRGAVSDLTSKLGIEGVDVIDGTEGLTEEQRKAKGWFDEKTGRIVVVLGNHGSKMDVMRTVLHEGVCHFGLRGLIGEGRLGAFLDGVFAKVDEVTRKRIAEGAKRHGWNVRVATEEYLASLAERTEFEGARKMGVWGKVKMLFGNVMRSMGLMSDGLLTDNELRFVLGMSYDRLKRGGREGWLDRANRIALERRLKVGPFEERKALTKVEEKNVEKNVLYREDRNRIVARDDYEREVSAAKHRLNVAWADSMSSLKILQDAIGKNGGKIEDWENAYMAENRMSSKNLAEMEAYKKSFYSDLIDAVDELTADGGATYEGVKEYMLAKHGLERNEVFAMRDAKRKAEDVTSGKIRKLEGIMNNPYATAETKKRVSAAINMMEAMRDGVENVLSAEDAKKWYDKRLKAIEARYKKGKYTDEQRDRAKRSLDAIMRDGLAQSYYYDFRERDYSGLTALTDMDSVVDAEMAARDIVDGFETEHDTTNLWEKTNAATDAMLTKDYESGLITKDMYGTLKQMFKYYIPLQGFDATTSDEVYTYMDNHNGRMGGVIRKAKGRMSLADDPIATIGNNASRSIMTANRNEMKQHFLKMVMNHPSDLVSVNKMYLHYDALTDEWVPQFADIPDGADAQTVKKITDAFYDRMEKLCKKAPDEYKVADEKANVPFKVVGANMNEHQVHVKMLGRDYVLTINGNPEAAQALNGLLAPEGHQGWAKAANNINNFIAKMFTQKNPAFIVTNLSRDAIYANTMVVAKENKVYRRRFHRNFGKNIVKLIGAMRRYSEGKLENNVYDKYYGEFVMNGGQTGYAFTKSVKEYKKLISKELEQRHRSKLNPKAWLNVLDKGITFLNEYSENVSRFTIYMTSREMGRSVERSIRDAKEITVNFNKRGAGKIVAGKWEEGNRLNYIQAWTSQNFRNAYVFFNAGVQGMSNVIRTSKAHKGKMLGIAATFFAAGMALPAITQALNMMLGGSEEEYYNLPEWVRRSNLCIYTGGGWVTIPLPIEMRAFYGLGELAYCATQGRQDENVATAALSQLTQILPIDFMEGGGGMQAFIPSHFKPIAEAYGLNKDWTGKPIYKETAFNENAPEWTKTYKGTNSVLTWLSKTANEWSGGDSVEKGDVDINPAKIQHVFEGYFGGVAKVLTKMYDTMAIPFDEDKREWRNVPVLSNLYQTADDKTRDRMTKNKFFEYYNEYMDTRDKLNRYEQKDNEDGLTLREKANYQTLLNSEKGVRKEIMDDYADDIKELRDDMKTLDEKSDAYKKDEAELIGIYREVNHAMMMADDAFAKKVSALWKKMDAINEKYKTDDDEELSKEDEAARERELEGPRKELNKLFDEAEGISEPSKKHEVPSNK